MARRRYKKSRRHSKSLFGMMKGALYTGAVAIPMYQGYQQLGGGVNQMANDVVARTTGYSMIGQKFDASYAMPTLGVVAASFVAHKVAGATGVNRYVPKWMPIKF